MKEKVIAATIGMIVLIGILVGLKFEITKELNKTPQEKFKDNYPLVSSAHPFVIRSEKEVMTLLDNGTGFLLIGNKNDLRSSSYVSILDEIGNGIIKEINYYEVESDFDTGQVKEKLEGMLDKNIKIEAPLLLMIKGGKIIEYENELLTIEKKEDLDHYWTEEKKEQFRQRLEQMQEEN